MAESKIYIQEGVKMQETYTFSRALHMMRYGGKKMRREVSDAERFYVKDNRLFRSVKINGKWDENWEANGLPSNYIMGSWVEVKD